MYAFAPLLDRGRELKGAEGAIAPPLFTVFNRLLLINSNYNKINNTYFIKSCTLISVNISTDYTNHDY